MRTSLYTTTLYRDDIYKSPLLPIPYFINYIKLANFNLKKCAWLGLYLVASNKYKLGFVQNLQISHNVDTRQKFC